MLVKSLALEAADDGEGGYNAQLVLQVGTATMVQAIAWNLPARPYAPDGPAERHFRRPGGGAASDGGGAARPRQTTLMGRL